MTKNQEKIQKVKAEIKVLEKKLSFLEELEKTKTPCEEAYNRVYGYYPVTNIGDTCWDGDNWIRFEEGYNAAQKDYKVGEYQETPEQGYWNYDPDAKFQPKAQEPAKDKVSLYKRFENEGAYGQIYYDNALEVVRGFLIDECVIEYENEEYVTITLQKSLLNVPND